MKDMSNSTRFAVIVLALVTASPAVAQGDDVQVLADWDYSTLYASGWSVESMFSATEIISADGETIGDVENIIFSDAGEALALIAEIGGVWDMGDGPGPRAVHDGNRPQIAQLGPRQAEGR